MYKAGHQFRNCFLWMTISNMLAVCFKFPSAVSSPRCCKCQQNTPSDLMPNYVQAWDIESILWGYFSRIKQSILVLVAAAAEAFTCVVAVVVYLFVQILLLLLLLGFLHVIVQFPYSCLTFLYSIKSQSKRGPLLLMYVIHLLIMVCELINQLSLASSTLLLLEGLVVVGISVLYESSWRDLHLGKGARA